MRKSYPISLGSVLAALAVVIMTLVAFIPIATYVCPLLCGILLFFVNNICGKRIAWAWYGAVAILGLLLSPDKEAAAVFVALGYYPIIKPKIDRLPLRWLWKGIYFNLVTAVLYAALLYVFGLYEIAAEFKELGIIGFVVTLLLGNVCFFMMDLTLRGLRIKFFRKK